jgi:hypothetical protein
VKIKTRKLPGFLKNLIRGLPLAGVVASALLPLHELARQFMILVILVWIQAFFILEVFLAGK